MESKMKETLEEVAERLYPISGPNSMWNSLQQDGFIEGAKWQQEQILQFLYSEITERRPYSSSKMCEEVIKFIEQFKKK
jgi:hypothetical protein